MATSTWHHASHCPLSQVPAPLLSIQDPHVQYHLSLYLTPLSSMVFQSSLLGPPWCPDRVGLVLFISSALLPTSMTQTLLSLSSGLLRPDRLGRSTREGTLCSRDQLGPREMSSVCRQKIQVLAQEEAKIIEPEKWH